MTLDTILNWAIPIAIVVFFIGIIYIKVKGPADQLLHWIGNGIKSMITGGTENARETILSTEIIYD